MRSRTSWSGNVSSSPSGIMESLLTRSVLTSFRGKTSVSVLVMMVTAVSSCFFTIPTTVRPSFVSRIDAW